MAGSEVITYGRIGVITEATALSSANRMTTATRKCPAEGQFLTRSANVYTVGSIVEIAEELQRNAVSADAFLANDSRFFSLYTAPEQKRLLQPFKC